MIPASSIIVDGDTAFWVVESDQITSFRIVDRPCDNQFTHDDTWDCPDCDGTGRHTFDIEYEDVDELGRAWKVPVHVIDVLPIISPGDQHEGDHITLTVIGSELAATNLWRADIDREGEPCHRLEGHVTLPAGAAPGMWLVRLKVHQEVGK